MHNLSICASTREPRDDDRTKDKDEEAEEAEEAGVGLAPFATSFCSQNTC
jgi:hypothetical protein